MPAPPATVPLTPAPYYPGTLWGGRYKVSSEGADKINSSSYKTVILYAVKIHPQWVQRVSFLPFCSHKHK